MKTLLLLPYFGSFPPYFDLWLASCGKNGPFDWLLITDQDLKIALPSNVRLRYSTLETLKKKFEKKMGISLVLNAAYKLCDYKQFYGYLFEEELKGYDYWGYCDCDLIFGDLRKFLTEDLQSQYDKVLRTGHFSVVRNDPAINRLFLQYETYKITLTSPVIYGYDEAVNGYHLGFAGELLEQGCRFGDFPKFAADIDFRHYPFREIHAPFEPCIFSYEHGRIYKITRSEGKIRKQERMYIHLQKRRMKKEKGLDPEHYLICPDGFYSYREEWLKSERFWESIAGEKKGYFDERAEKRKNRIRDLRRLMHEPHKLESIRYRLRKEG